MAKKTIEERLREARETGAAELDLSYQGLMEIPPGIGDLNELRELNLDGNLLTELPAELWKLAELRDLNLRYNLLSELPPEIGRLERLRRLDVRQNRLAHLPEELWQLKQLRILFLPGNQLAEPPPELWTLSELREIDLADFGLTELPPELWRLPKLEVLGLDRNQLKALPAEIGQLAGLRKLFLAGNQLTELPPELWRATGLQLLSLGGNRLTKIPEELWRLTELQELGLGKSRLRELPPTIAQLSSLQKLYIADNQLTELPPELWQLTELQVLSLGGNRLTKIPEELWQLTELRELSLNMSQLKEVPSEIGQLAKLQKLWLNENQLTGLPAEVWGLGELQLFNLLKNRVSELPPEVGRLTSLQKLWLNDNQLTELPAELWQLTELRVLGLGGNKLGKLPEQLWRLTELQELSLNRIELETVPPEIGRLASLQKLWLDDNRLTELPAELWQLTLLRELFLHKNQLEELPADIGRLRRLEKLWLSDNRLEELPDTIGRLRELQTLWLNDNQLSELPNGIGRLTELRELWLRKNELKRLPAELENLTHLEKLALHDNDALGIPPEVLGPRFFLPRRRLSDPADILAYYFKSRSEASRLLLEAKLLILGQGAVGKSSLVKRLVEDGFDPREPKTDGIEIHRWGIPGKDDQEIRVNIWDFGGQEIMHATHQFFLTERSLYVLVLDARKGQNEGNLYYWLRTIKSYGKDSPILVVVNKSEPPNELELNEYRLKKDYPSIKGFFKTSCLKGRGIPGLRRTIAREIQGLEHVYNVVPESYLETKDELEVRTQSEDFIEHDEYERICEAKGVGDRQSRETLLRFLHDLGSILHFDDDAFFELRETKILNPEWVTQGVYKILNSSALAREGGVLTSKRLSQILTKKAGYPTNGRRFILGMMHKFELCFEFSDGSHRYLVPELLPENEPASDLDEEDALRFEYHYELLPEGVLPRFIVRMHPHLSPGSSMWRSGVLIEIDGNRVQVRGDTQRDRVFVAVFDSPVGRRRALTVVRTAFRAIHQSFPGHLGREMIPLPKDPGRSVSYRHLLRLEAANDRDFLPEGAEHRYSVSELLDGIEDSAERRDLQPVEYIGQKIEVHGPATFAETIDARQVHIDAGHLPQLAAELAELRRRLLSQASEPEHFHQIGEVSAAEKAAAEGDVPKTEARLVRVGKWAYREAKELTTGVLTGYLTNLSRGT